MRVHVVVLVSALVGASLLGCGADDFVETRGEVSSGGEDLAGRFDAADTGHLDDAQVDQWSGADVFDDSSSFDVSDTTSFDASVDATDTSSMDLSPEDTMDTVDCLLGVGSRCDPIEITSWPFIDQRDTAAAPDAALDGYSCAPMVDESGGEFIYHFEVLTPGLLRAELDDAPGDSVDVDIHLLDALDEGSCLVRDNVGFNELLQPGTYYLVVDTWVNGSGVALSGEYELIMEWLELPSGECAMDAIDLPMYWADCDPSLDCLYADDAGVTIPHLRTPATGPVVKEAHLVTTLDAFGGGWPQSFTDGIDAHYALSEGVSGFSVTRAEPWAPAGEGGSEFGQGSTGSPLPPDAEAWYVNMYWRHRPPAGTRLLVVNPENGRAVIAAGGYETGPGSNTSIGGAAEEIHLYLGTQHRETLIMGFLSDQSLPYGPVNCVW